MEENEQNDGDDKGGRGSLRSCLYFNSGGGGCCCGDSEVECGSSCVF